MNITLIQWLQLLVSLSLLVVLHEGGHFGFAKLFKVRVEKFFMFFDYKFHLFSTRDNWFTRLFPRFKNNETEYGIGWIPLGGYVKIAGMVDESLDTEQMKQEAKPDEFRSQKIWKRFLIMVGGVLVNLLTAFAIYSGMMLANGEDRLPVRNITNGLVYNQEAQAIGFRNGDVPIRIDNNEIEYLPGGSVSYLMQDFSEAQTVTVLRDNKEVTLQMPVDGISLLDMLEMQPPFMQLLTYSDVSKVAEGSAAAKAGMKDGARLTAIDGTPIQYWSDFDSLYQRKMDVLSLKTCTHADSIKQRMMTVAFLNPGASQPDTVTLQLDEDYRMGVNRSFSLLEYEFEHIDYNLLTCVPAGVKYGWQTLVDYVRNLKYVATAKGAKSVGSFFTIADIFPKAWDWNRFWHLTALISIILAVMNILPIPGLDGGHVVILLFEAITGRQPSEKVMVWLEYIGLACIIALMLLALGNDIRRFILPWFFG